MKVKNLIKKLKEISKDNEDKEVFFVTEENNGCETCGWGNTIDEEECFEITDMDTKIWLKKY